MQHGKITKISIREDYPTGVASSLHGANLNCMAFNSEFIAVRDPLLNVQIMELFERANALKDKLPLGSNHSDFTKSGNRMRKLSINE